MVVFMLTNVLPISRLWKGGRSKPRPSKAILGDGSRLRPLAGVKKKGGDLSGYLRRGSGSYKAALKNTLMLRGELQ